MKKLIAMLLAFTLVLSMCAVNVFAATYDKTVWVQDFEGADVKADGAAANAAYDTGARYNSAASGGVSLITDGNDNTHLTVYPNSNSVDAGTKVILKQVFEQDKKYKLVADVELDAYEGAAADYSVKVVARVLRGTAHDTAHSGSTITLKDGEKATVSTKEFSYSGSETTHDGGINFRAEMLSVTKVSDTVKDRLKVDNVRIVEVVTGTQPTNEGSVFSTYNLGETLDFENLDYDHLRGSTDCGNNGDMFIVKDPENANNMVLRGALTNASNTYARNELIGVLANANPKEGKTYKVSFKLYPQGSSNVPVYVSLKDTITSVVYVGLTSIEINPVANQWNDVSFTYTLGKDTAINLGYTQRPLDGKSMDFSANTYYEYLYIDDVVVEEVYTENSKFIFDKTTADAGYYADVIDADEKEGAIAFTSTILENYLDLIESYGMYFYRTDIVEDEKNISLPSEDVASLKTAKGVFAATVEEIPEGYFTTRVVAKPYIIINGKIIYGEPTYYGVNDANKWLGPKAE